MFIQKSRCNHWGHKCLIPQIGFMGNDFNRNETYPPSRDGEKNTCWQIREACGHFKKHETKSLCKNLDGVLVKGGCITLEAWE